MLARLGRLLGAAGLVAAVGCGTASDPGSGGSGGGGDGGGVGEPAKPLVEEAGFVALPEPRAGPAEEGRMFYSFRPADTDPEDKPLVVFFNGGPGSATTSILLPFGTGPKTLEAWAELPLVVKPNPHSWTRFANLLYLDSRGAGFSYELAPPACSSQTSANAPLSDAADFTIGLLEFLADHPRIRGAKVVLAGESYGGARAMLMERLLIETAEETATDAWLDEQFPALRGQVLAHVEATRRAVLEGPGRPARAGAGAAAMRAQFGHAVLIEPALGGQELDDELHTLRETRGLPNATTDTYDIRRSASEAARLAAATDDAMRDPARLEALLGVPLGSIAGLAAGDRGEGVRFGAVVPEWVRRPAEPRLEVELGKLPRDDAYYLPAFQVCMFGIQDVPDFQTYVAIPEVDLFITRAKFDAAVFTSGLPAHFEKYGVHAWIDESAPVGAARPGVLHVALDHGEATIRFPEYAAGHEVTMTAGAELAEDVEIWLRERGLIR